MSKVGKSGWAIGGSSKFERSPWSEATAEVSERCCSEQESETRLELQEARALGKRSELEAGSGSLVRSQSCARSF